MQVQDQLPLSHSRHFVALIIDLKLETCEQSRIQGIEISDDGGVARCVHVLCKSIN